MFERLKAQVLELDDSEIDPKELAGLIDALQGKLCRVVAAGAKRGDHLLSGQNPIAWVARVCSVSKNSAADRLCVGRQLDSLVEVGKALESGQIGYQAVSVICHLNEDLEKHGDLDDEEWIANARRFSIRELRYQARDARQVLDPDGSDQQAEEDFEQRSLQISETWKGWYCVEGWLDPVGGANLKCAIDALSHPLGETDRRSPKQRRADALNELINHALDRGTLPKRSGVRPHISVHATISNLKDELGETAAHLGNGMPISNKTVQRLACDGTLHRVLKADSMVIDVGRATRAVHNSQRRGVNARYRTCCGPGCDRPVSMTSVHHLEFWGKGGASNLPNMIPLCYYHHRLVHEGGWRVIKAGEEIRWIPPDRLVSRWAA